MAKPNTLNNKLHELLTCPVCLDTYREARTLHCLHSFCTECLEGCRRVLRRDIECPVCKRVTVLPSDGVRGLPADYRIEQIRDYIAFGSQCVDAPPVNNNQTSVRICDVCKTQQLSTPASQHCIQCLMQLCDGCVHRHNANPVLALHQLVSINDRDAAALLFCVLHREQPIRYFCCQCHSTLCTICAIEHDPSHKPESLETGIINKYRSRLSEALSSLASRLAEVKTRAKRLEALKQSCQTELYTVQQNIKERTAQIVEHVRRREARLLSDAQAKFDASLSPLVGSDSLAELDFRRSELESLVNEVRLVLGGPPQTCLMAFDELNARVTRLTESSQSTLPTVRLHPPKSVFFVPAPESEMELMIGCLQECCFTNAGDDSEGPSTTSSPSRMQVNSPATIQQTATSAETSSTRKRTASILGALSPARKTDSRMSRVKGLARSNGSSAAWRDNSAGDSWRDTWRDSTHSLSAGRQINFDNIVGSTTTSTSTDSPSSPLSRTGSVGLQPPTSPSSVSSSLMKLTMPVSPSSSSSPMMPVTTNSPIRLLFKIDQVGGLPGMIQCPVAVSFVSTGDVLVAECDRRIQQFDCTGRSVKVIGWGNIKPHAVHVGPDGFIAVAEKTSQTIRFYGSDGSDAIMKRRWPERMFGMPCDVAIAKATGHVVVADSDRRSVTVHSAGGAVLTRIPSDQLGNPTHVAISDDGTVYVSDAQHSCVKIFDSSGQFILQFALPSSSQSSPVNSSVRPYGLCLTQTGHLYVCDRDGHRILVFTTDGQYVGDLLQSVDSSQSVRYPCHVAVHQTTDNGTMVAVAESCNGLLDNDRHHAIKLYSIQ